MYIFESMVKNLDNAGKFLMYPRVLDLENTMTAQAQEITSLKLRVKKLEKKRGSRTHKLKRSYKVGRSARVISSDEASLDDIIFGFIKKSLCTEFEKIMHKKFQMSSMGELTFFLGLQHTYGNSKLLLRDEDGEEVDVHLYRSIIGSLMYLISSRPDIMFAVCACARYQVNPKVSHLHVVKKIFRLVAYTDSDYARASLDRKSTIGVAFLSKPAESEGFEQIVDFLNAHTIKYALTINPTIYTSCIKQFWATVKVKTVNREQQLQALVDGKKIVVTEASVRRDLQLDDEEGTDYLPNATIFEELTRMGRPKEKDTEIPHSSIPSDPTNAADEDSLKLKELMELFKRLEKKRGLRTHKLKRLYKVGRSARVVSSEEASLGVLDSEEVFAGQDMAEKEVSTTDLVTIAGEVVTTANVEVSTASPTEATIADELTLAQTLIEIKSAKPKVKGVVIGEQSESTTRTRP
ncbi:hypothetical protein Tco_0219133 [Tanacetum coccineum]